MRCTASPEAVTSMEARDAPHGASPRNLISMKFYYVYVLKSIQKDFIYVGYTTNLHRRFQEHNNKQELSTKHYAPFDLIFYEAYRNVKDAKPRTVWYRAKRREEYLKTTKGKTTLRSMLKEFLQA